jgi:beta-D-xylosidase 4
MARPDLNLIVDPRNGRNGENPSEDGYLAGAYAIEYVKGAQESPDDPKHIMLSMALKHFAGYQSETNRMASNFAFSAFDLLDTYLKPYEMGFKEGGAVGSMCAYDSINNISSCADEWLLTKMVKEYWGRPDTYTMSDCGAIENQFSDKHTAASFADASAKSIVAGTDWCMGTAFVLKNGVADAIKQQLMTEADLDTALSRTLSVRMKLGMFDSTPGSVSAFRNYGKEQINTALSRQAADEAAAQGAILLRNENSILPLKASSVQSIAVIGPHAVSRRDLLGDFYADAFCPGKSTPAVRADQCVPTIGGSVSTLLGSSAKVHVEAGVSMVGPANVSSTATAVAAAMSSDVVILAVGYNNAGVEREGFDHNYTTLPAGQLALADAVIAAAKQKKAPVVMLLINAGQIATDNLAAQPDVLIEAFYPAFGAPALVRQIFGLSNYWGRLPYTIYEAAFADAIELSDMHVSGKVGRTWRYYQGKPNYDFGDGLSYSQFSLTCAGGLAAETTPTAGQNFSVSASCRSALTSGMQDGDEILLVKHRVGPDVLVSVGGRHPVPHGTLREFARLSLSHGGPAGASAFELGPLDFALTNEAGESVLYPGTHFIDVSPRAPGAKWTLAVKVAGTAPVVLATPPPLPR